MFPGLTELHFIECLIESTWPQKSKSSTSTKNQLADILSKRNFTRDEWNHLLCLFNISHFSSTVCSEIMAKILQQDSGEERVTAKYRPMMSLTARAPSNVSSSTSVRTGKRSYGHQNPWSTIDEKEEGSWRPDIGIDRIERLHLITIITNNSWKVFLQHVAQSGMMTVLGLVKSGKTDTEMHERSERPDETSWRATREIPTWFSLTRKLSMMEPRNPL